MCPSSLPLISLSRWMAPRSSFMSPAEEEAAFLPLSAKQAGRLRASLPRPQPAAQASLLTCVPGRRGLLDAAPARSASEKQGLRPAGAAPAVIKLA